MTMEPARIVRLSEDVINRIAAGEVIQRPSNALKELLENSLDAQSTQIKLFLRDGGITELRIEDNGTGILPDDFPLLCERFATSKLNKFEDLYGVKTYGFRGEALASISFCGQLTITSKAKGASCAYRANFVNGCMSENTICAGMGGTQIIVRKLFYNMSLRRKALKSRSAQEYNSCLRVVGCYAIHNFHCSFSVQKTSDSIKNCIDLKTNKCKRSLGVIKAIYGGDIASYLVEFEAKHSKISDLYIQGVLSNTDFAMNVAQSSNRNARTKAKKRIFSTNNRMELVLFINDRLIESNLIKKCIMNVYAEYLAKNHFPFVYLAIFIPPKFVDVNVHPTKKEVKFLHKDEVMQLIQDTINEKLKKESKQKVFHAHSLQHFMNQSQTEQKLQKITQKTDIIKTAKTTTTKIIPEKRKFAHGHSDLVKIELGKIKKPKKVKKSTRNRVDSQQDSLDFYWTQQKNKLHNAKQKVTICKATEKIKKRVVDTSFVDDLMAMIYKNGDENLKNVFEQNVFVGIVDSNDVTMKKNESKMDVKKETFQRVMFQFETKLFLCDIYRISRIYFFELCIKNIGKFEHSLSLKFDDLSIFNLMMMALDLEESGYSELSKEEKKTTANELKMTLCLPQIAQILNDYFSIGINTKNEKIECIPLLIEGYIPPLLCLPIFLCRLVSNIEWFEDENDENIKVNHRLFKSISMEVARFYQIRPPLFYVAMENDLKWIIKHVIFRSMNAKQSKYSFHPPRFLKNDGSIVQIACTKQLYKVFERC